MGEPSARDEARHVLRDIWHIVRPHLVFFALYGLLWAGGRIVERAWPDMARYADAVDRVLLYLVIPLHAFLLAALVVAHVYQELRAARKRLASPPLSDEPARTEPPPPPVAEPARGEELPGLVGSPGSTGIAEPVETFTGRDEFVGTVIEAVRRHRVVTLCGLGGVGKTEVARAICVKLTQERWPPGGVRYVDLQAATRGDAAAAEIQATLGLSPFRDFRGLAGQLEGDRLYVLDDLFLAHARDPDGVCALLRTLRDYTTEARFLVTCRDPLRLMGVEHEVPVPVLTLEAAEALFRAEAKECRYQWAEGDENLLGGLLDELAGWPLAVALAARQLGVLSLATLVDEWRARKTAALALGAGEDRNVSVDTSLLVSYDHLPEADLSGASPEGAARPLFGLFAALPAGATPEMLHAIIGDGGVPAAALLARQGLLNRTGDRFTMLMPVRQFAGSLSDADADELRARLEAYLLDFAEHWGGTDDAWIRDQGTAVRRLLAELPNLHQMLDRAGESLKHDLTARLTDALDRFYHFAMPGREAVERLLAGAEAAQIAGDKRRQANCTSNLGDVHRMLAQYVEARGRYEEALPIYREIGDRLGEANCIKSLGDVHLELAEYEEARGRYEEALPIHREIGDRLGEANCIRRLGDVHLGLADPGKARRRYQDALAVYREIGHRLGEANCLRSLGDVHLQLAEYGEARGQYEEALPIYREIGGRLGEANCIKGLGDVHRRLAEYEEARGRYEAAQAIYTDIGSRYNIAATTHSMALLEKAEGHTEKAITTMDEAAALFEECGVEVWAERCRRTAQEWRGE